jgi:poly-gamma-glutamate capsule biosynthesis protein CapA/YwtB (metallophosphatase superfamily)
MYFNQLTRRDLVRKWTKYLLIANVGGVLAACSVNSESGRVVTPTIIPSPTATATPVPQPVSLVLTGDMMLARSVGTQMVAAGQDGVFPFIQTGDFLHKFDLRVGNLECVVSKIGAKVNKQYTFEADPLGFHRLQQIGFNVLSVANNHSGDYGPDAFADMLHTMPQYGLQYMGGGLNETEAHTPLVVDKKGTRIAFVAACNIGPDSFTATSTRPGHAWLTAEGLRQDIPRARASADFVIVFTHWGVEYNEQYNSSQQSLAHLAIDLGADLVCGMHPHVVQGNEMYKGKLIVYSLGNFIFDLMYDNAAHGNLLTLSILKNQLLDWKLVPITINTSTGAPYLS